MIGGVRVFNPTTGKGPDDDEGCAVKVVSILRDARVSGPPNYLAVPINRPWALKEYLDAPGAVRTGESYLVGKLFSTSPITPEACTSMKLRSENARIRQSTNSSRT
jgi:hypothetical protein